jgi:arylsulfatase A-like enzyme
MGMGCSSRREFLRRLGVAGVGLAGCVHSSAGAAAGARNVLFIAIDDLNDWVGCLGGHPDVQTPHLDRLASQGVLFTNAYCAAPACNPSRAALMTGILPSTSGVYHNSQPWRKSAVLASAVTLPQHFRAAGYRAMGSGKIYHGGFPDPPSWDEYWPSQTQNKPPDPVPANRPVNGIPNTAHFDWGPLEAEAEQMGDWQVADWVTGKLREDQAQPFFLACGFFRPHLPWYVPRRFFELYPEDEIALPNVNDEDLSDVPEAGRRMARPDGDHRRVLAHGQWRKAVRGYLASISFVDECVGRVMAALDSGPHRDDTVVVLWSDHGWHLGEKLHWRKFALWEEATHNVLMFRVPGVTAAGGRCDWPVGLIDIYPTLVEICGLAPRPELEGASLMPLLRNPRGAWERPALTTHGRNNHSVRSLHWRYIRYGDGAEELYDHRVDPLEWRNLAGAEAHAGVISDLRRWLPEVNAADDPPRRRRQRRR